MTVFLSWLNPDDHELAANMYTFTIEDHHASEDVQVLSQGLTVHSPPYTQIPGFQSIASRDEHGARVGGVWGYNIANFRWVRPTFSSPVVSPEVSADRKVTLRWLTPKAKPEVA